MKRLLGVLLTITFIFSLNVNVTAASDTLHNVHSEAFINEDGTVNIEQTWIYDDSGTNGTEHYINMDITYGAHDTEESISNYSVTRNGEEMIFEDDWNVNSDFNEKANKYGYLEVDNGIELTFGITEKTENEFTIKYKAHNIIKETTDGYKYMHWTFLPTELNPKPNELSAKVNVADGLNIDKIYGFNYIGDIEFTEDGDSVVAKMDKGSYDDFTTLNIFTLIEGDIQNTNKVQMTIESKAQEMLKGSDYDSDLFFETEGGVVEEKGSPLSWFFQPSPNGLFNFLGEAFIPLFIITGIFGTMIAVTYYNPHRQLIRSIDKETLRKLKKDEDFYYRDEPQDTVDLSILLSKLGFKKMNENILAYFVSKWTSDDVFRFVEEGVYNDGLFRKTKGVKFEIIYKNLAADTDLERDLFAEFYRITDRQRMLNTVDLKKMSMSNVAKILQSHARGNASTLRSAGYIEGEKTDYQMTDNGVNVLEQHVGLRNFLSQFTLIEERSASEIKLWDYHFHLAAFYGIADEFSEQLKLSIVDNENRSMYNKYYGTTGSSLLSSSVRKSVTKNYSDHIRSSGGGGSSSSGGGGGSSGGGSGGGTR